jgi:hypothetical protein
VGIFKRLSKVELSSHKPHQHVAYFNDEGGVRVSDEENHSHEVTWIEAQVDETGAEVAPGEWQVVPDPMDGHSHDLEDIETKYPKLKESDDDVVRDILSLFEEGLQCEQEYLDKAEEAEGFYTGEGQWSDEQRGYLEGLNRACLTLNYTQKHVDELVGYQRQQRTEWRFMPVEGGDQVAADVFNYLTKYVTEQCNFEMEDTGAFEDAAIGGRGNLNLYMDFSRDIRGELKIERYPYDQVVYGPHQKIDASDCEYLHKHKMVSLGRLKQLAPKKWKTIERSCELFAGEFGKKSGHVTRAGDQYALSDNRTQTGFSISGVPLVDVARKEYRIIECWRKVFLEVSVIGVPEDDFYFAAWGWKGDDLRSVEKIGGAGVVKRTVQKMRVSRICGRTLLNDEYPADLPVDDFFVVPVYAKKRGQKFWGKVEAVKDVQRELNYRRSQMIDIGNKMIAYGYFYDADTFADDTEAERFKESSSSPGFTSKLSSTERPPVQVEGVKFPGELAQMAQLAAGDVAELMNIQVVPEGANDSGKKLLQLQQNRLRGNEFIFDNHKFAKKKLGKLIPPLLQKFYKTRAYRILLNQSTAEQPVELGGQPIGEFTEEQVTQVMENADAVQYDLILSEVTASPTQRALVSMMLTEMMQAGNMPPPELIAEFSDLPKAQKDKMVAAFTAQQEAAAQSEQDKQSSEVEKVMMSKGLITPALAEKYQIPPEMVPGLQGQQEEQPMPEEADPALYS